jgi:hypothetical protein
MEKQEKDEIHLELTDLFEFWKTLLTVEFVRCTSLLHSLEK